MIKIRTIMGLNREDEVLKMTSPLETRVIANPKGLFTKEIA